jgi:hypothetical protein
MRLRAGGAARLPGAIRARAKAGRNRDEHVRGVIGNSC